MGLAPILRPVGITSDVVRARLNGHHAASTLPLEMIVEMAVRVLGAIAALPMLANGFGWIQNPARVAESLGMPLLDGLGRSTQIGDFTSFFLSAALLGLFGVLRKSAGAFFAAALLLGLAAIGRLLATALHDAPVASLFITVEIVLAIVWIGCGLFFQRTTASR